MKRSLIILLIAILSISTSYAQNYISIKGKVVDNKSSNAISQASINLKGTFIFNVSNSEGFFTLKIPAGTPSDAVISVSCPGFITSEYPISEFADLGADMYLRIPMLPFNLTLDSTVAGAVDPETLFYSAFAKVSQNYAQQPVGMTAFYRETVKKGRARHIILDEVALDIEKSPYINDSSDKVSINKGRSYLDPETSDAMFSKYQGGLAAALSLDMIKNPFIGTTLSSAGHFYDFTIESIVSIDNRTFYVVCFKPKDGIEPFLFTGRIFIEDETLAIGRIEFSMDIGDKKEEAAGEFILKRTANTEFKISSADYLVIFKEFNGQWYLGYCKTDIVFSARKKNSISKTNYSISSEMVVTDHKEEGVKISNDQKKRYRGMLSDDSDAFRDDRFWEGYNVIEPEFSVEQTIRKISNRSKKDLN